MLSHGFPKVIKSEIMSHCLHCGKSCAGKCDKCSVCGKVDYCGAECARNDWTLHQQDCNLADVESKNVVVAVPHAFHDVLSDKHFTQQDKTLLNTGYSIRHKASDGTVSQRVQAPIERKTEHVEVPARHEHKDYTVTVNGHPIAKGNSLRNAVCARAPGRGGQLAATRDNKGFTLWSPVKDSRAVVVSKSEPTVLRFAVPQLDVGHEMVVLVPAMEEYQDQYEGLSRRARGALEQQYQIKGVGQRSTQVLPMMATDHTGRVVRMLFDVKDPEMAHLVDVEYGMPSDLAAPSPEWQSQKFACSAKVGEDVMGLLGAVRDKIEYGSHEITQYKEEHGKIENDEEMRELQDRLNGLESDYHTVESHYQDYFINKTSTKVSPEVRSAIHRLTHDNQNIGAIVNPYSLSRKPLPAILKKVDDWIDQYMMNIVGEKKDRGVFASFKGGKKSRRYKRRVANNALSKLRVARSVLERIKKKGKHQKYKLKEDEKKKIDEKLETIRDLLVNERGAVYERNETEGTTVEIVNPE